MCESVGDEVARVWFTLKRIGKDEFDGEKFDGEESNGKGSNEARIGTAIALIEIDNC